MAFATWGGLRGAISLIMCQVIVTDEALAQASPLVAAQVRGIREGRCCFASSVRVCVCVCVVVGRRVLRGGVRDLKLPACAAGCETEPWPAARETERHTSRLPPGLAAPALLQIGLWVSLFVLSTLLINAPTIPAVLRFTGLAEASKGSAVRLASTGQLFWAFRQQQSLFPHAFHPSGPLCQVSPVKLSIREKAKRALLRYTAAAIQARLPCSILHEQHRLWAPRGTFLRQLCQHCLPLLAHLQRTSVLAMHMPPAPPSHEQDLKSDEDEMLRGVDWGAVARYVDLSEELHQFDRGQGGVQAALADPSEPPTPRSSQAPASPASAQDTDQRQEEAAEVLRREEELFGAAGWAVPSSGGGTVHSRRAEALAGLGWAVLCQGAAGGASPGRLPLAAVTAVCRALTVQGVTPCRRCC